MEKAAQTATSLAIFAALELARRPKLFALQDSSARVPLGLANNLAPLALTTLFSELIPKPLTALTPMQDTTRPKAHGINTFAHLEPFALEAKPILSIFAQSISSVKIMLKPLVQLLLVILGLKLALWDLDSPWNLPILFNTSALRELMA